MVALRRDRNGHDRVSGLRHPRHRSRPGADEGTGPAGGGSASGVGVAQAPLALPRPGLRGDPEPVKDFETRAGYLFCMSASREGSLIQASVGEQKGSVTINELIYIGESGDVRARMANHEGREACWNGKLAVGETLCYSTAAVTLESARQQAEAALIFHHKPPATSSMSMHSRSTSCASRSSVIGLPN